MPAKSEFRKLVERQNGSSIDEILSDADLTHPQKLFLIAHYDPTGPIFRASFRSSIKADKETKIIRKAIAQRYDVSEKFLEDTEVEFRSRKMLQVLNKT